MTSGRRARDATRVLATVGLSPPRPKRTSRHYAGALRCIPRPEATRHRAAVSWRILTPGRDLADRAPLIQSLPGANSEILLYAEDINDQLQQIVADLAAIEDRCTALLGLHSSA
jgi:hypothetical protein